VKHFGLAGLLILSVVLGVQALPPFPAPQIVGRVTTVVDGDTLDVLITSLPEEAPQGLAEGQVARVRYIGVDAPELADANGLDATDLNYALVAAKTVYLELDEEIWDAHGRLLAYVYLDPGGYLMVNLMLVATEIVTARYDPGTSRYQTVFRYFDAVPAPTLPPEEACLPWDQAQARVGEVSCVRGEVASVGTSRGGDVFINLGNPYPNENRFTIYIPARCVGRFEAQFGPRFWRPLEGKIVSAFGEISLYRGIPEIELCDPSRLVIEGE
jgi:endonuclease YncB( thermonuclease family)